MAAINLMRAIAAVIAVSSTTAGYAQQPDAAPSQPTPEPKLAFDREVYSYATSARRDPFRALVGKESLGPLFEDLKLRGIIYSPEASSSIVLLQDGSKRQYRLRRGEVVGNSRVVEIKPLAVRFAVENFGMIKYETLELRAGGVYTPPPTGFAAASPPQNAPEQVKANEPRVDFPNNDPARSKMLIDSIAKERRDKTAKPQSKSDARQSATETPR